MSSVMVRGWKFRSRSALRNFDSAGSKLIDLVPARPGFLPVIFSLQYTSSCQEEYCSLLEIPGGVITSQKPAVALATWLGVSQDEAKATRHVHERHRHEPMIGGEGASLAITLAGIVPGPNGNGSPCAIALNWSYGYLKPDDAIPGDV